MDFSVVMDVLISLTAIGGLILGIYNYRRDKKKDEVGLKIKPLSIHSMGDGNAFGYSELKIQNNREFKTIGVKIINLSKFDVTLSEVGFSLIGNVQGEKLAFPDAITLGDSKCLPVRLPSRESVIMVFKPEQLPASSLKQAIENIYVVTGCDLYFYGSSGVLKDFANMESKRA